MANHFQNIFEQLADFHGISGYDGWMIGACIYEQRHVQKQGGGLPEERCGQTENAMTADSCQAEIVKSSPSFAVMRNRLEADGIRYRLELHVVKPEEQADRNDGAVPANSDRRKDGQPMQSMKAGIAFSQTDVLRFVDAVGDENSIHRTAHAVVPGLLMVEWMLGKLRETGNLTESLEAGNLKCRFRFENPVFVDEKLQVEDGTERGKQIYECKREDDKEIVWNMRIL